MAPLQLAVKVLQFMRNWGHKIRNVPLDALLSCIPYDLSAGRCPD